MSGLPETYQGRRLRHDWPYHNAQGDVIGRVARYDGGDGTKAVVPCFKRNGNGWAPGAAKAPRPLFNLAGLASAPADARVYVTEGEKCSAALAGLGMLSTTSQGGANAARSADWSALQRFRSITILPDADDAGETYAAEVAACLAALPGAREVAICRLPGLGAGGDVVDWLLNQGIEWDGYSAVPREPGDDLVINLEADIRQYSELATAEAAAADIEAWPEPVPLDAVELPPWPAVFPEPVQAFVDAAAAWTETPPELAAMAVLATLAAAVQGKHVIETKPGHTEPLALWTLCALPPGSRKSAVFKTCTFPLYHWEQEEHKRLAPVIEAAASEAQTAAGRVKELRRSAARTDDDEERRNLTQVIAKAEAAIPVVPGLPRLFTSDITPERLAALMAENNGSMAVLADEAGFLETFAGRYQAGKANLDILLQGHSGTPVRVDRLGREAVFLDNPVLTIGIAPQNSVLREMASHEAFRGRGLLARFLFAMPRPTLGNRTHKTAEIPREVLAAYNSTIKALLVKPWPLEDDRVVPHVLHLTDGAYQSWLEFTLHIEPQLKEGGTLGHLTDFGGKLPGAVGRIAGVLHMATHAFENAEALPVAEDTMCRAVELGQVLAAHALVAFDAMGADAAMDDARHALKWVMRNAEPSFTKRDAHAAMQSRFPRADDIGKALDILAERHFVRPVPGPVKPQGGRPRDVYQVNPAICEK
ncbi:MAG: DUF3987 domain-containing protein [Candidatus Hydrogenedentales bacterium]|jgi:hypothetical protein